MAFSEYNTVNMKSVLAIISIIGFVSVAVFGFLAIGHINEMAHSGCLAALAQNGVCPSATNVPLAAAFSHLNILRSFSSALLNNAALLLTLVAMAGISFGAMRIPVFSAYLTEASSFLPRLLQSGDNSISRNFEWLAIHFNSPSFVLSA